MFNNYTICYTHAKSIWMHFLLNKYCSWLYNICATNCFQERRYINIIIVIIIIVPNNVIGVYFRGRGLRTFVSWNVCGQLLNIYFYKKSRPFWLFSCDKNLSAWWKDAYHMKRVNKVIKCSGVKIRCTILKYFLGFNKPRF